MSAQPAHASSVSEAIAASGESNIFVTMRINNQLFGIAVKDVRDVLKEQKITCIPLSPNMVAGSLNLRGRIVTVIDVRKRLQLASRSQDTKNMFVVVEYKNELYSLMVDSVGEVMTVPAALVEKPPANLGGEWKEIASGIYKMPNELLVIIDVGTVLSN